MAESTSLFPLLENFKSEKGNVSDRIVFTTSNSQQMFSSKLTRIIE